MNIKGVSEKSRSESTLRLFGHVERMDEYRMAKVVDGGSEWRVGTREFEVRLDGMMVALGIGGKTVGMHVNARKIGKSG